MRRPIPATLALAAVLAAPAPAAAKGVVAMSVCGTNACHRVDRAAVRHTADAYTPAAAPGRAEPFFTIRAKARVSSGRVVEAFALDWLPRAGLTRPSGERMWARPAPALAAALRRAARGLRAHPAARLGAVGPPTARITEVFAPAKDDDDRRPIVAGAALLAALGALAIRRSRTTPR
jgi:MYXO-CTERM domain-containing protein